MAIVHYLVSVDEETGTTLSVRRIGPNGELVDEPLPQGAGVVAAGSVEGEVDARQAAGIGPSVGVADMGPRPSVGVADMGPRPSVGVADMGPRPSVGAADMGPRPSAGAASTSWP